MTRRGKGIVVFAAATIALAHCGKQTTIDISPHGDGGRDGAPGDSSGGCGASAQPCCNGTACNAGLSCTLGACSPLDATADRHADGACSSGANGCSGSQPQKCIAGTWIDQGAVCSGGNPVCLDGDCVACEPKTTQCQGNGVETCASTGRWLAPVDCSGSKPFCQGGACVDSPPSCEGSGEGLTNCGSTSENCCTSPEVTGGRFYRTYSNSGAGSTGEADPATVSSFRLDKYLVTVGRFRQFVNYLAAGGTPPADGSGKHAYLNGGHGLVNTATEEPDGAPNGYETGWSSSWNALLPTTVSGWTTNLDCYTNTPTWTSTPGPFENLPINCENWYEAYAFCIYDGGFLPSEAEWEYAAAAGTAQLEYPWGSTDPGTANQYAIYGCYYPGAPVGCPNTNANIAPVGTATLGAGQWGQLDIVGDLWKWNVDWYQPTFDDPSVNGANLTVATDLVMHGGNYTFPAANLLPTDRSSHSPPTYRSDHLGIECARAP
jgi:formylglycine-generating enzyme